MDTIKQAAALTGVSAHTLRAWERRYGLFSPTRTTSGYRVYDEQTIGRIRLMSSLVSGGMAPRDAAAEVRRRSTALRSGAPEPRGPASDVGLDLVEAAAALDVARVSRILDEQFARGDFETVVQDWLMPALNAVGRAWASDRLSVAGEHLVANAVLRRLSAAYEAAGRGWGPPVIIGAPPGVQHELGLLAFAVAARRAGLATLYLGRDVPLEAWSQAVATVEAKGVVTTAPRRRDVARVAQLAQMLADTHPELPVWVGGRFQHLVPPPARTLGHSIVAAASTLAGTAETQQSDEQGEPWTTM